MAMELVVSPNPIQERDARLARHFEQVVAEALRGREDLVGSAPVRVRFHVWDGDDVARYVCKVECSDAPGAHLEEPPWRWWSPLVQTPQELAQELREALRRRARPEEARPEEPAERWGWGGETSAWTT